MFEAALPTEVGTEERNSAPPSIDSARPHLRHDPTQTAITGTDRDGQSTDLYPTPHHVGIARPTNLAIAVAPRSRLLLLQEWEGLVEEVDPENGCFRARLYDLRVNDTHDVELAEFYIDDVEQDDRELIVPGGVFRWIIGYRDKVLGKRERVSSIVFRRLPAWTREDLKRSEERGKSLANALRWE